MKPRAFDSNGGYTHKHVDLPAGAAGVDPVDVLGHSSTSALRYSSAHPEDAPTPPSKNSDSSSATPKAPPLQKKSELAAATIATDTASPKRSLAERAARTLNVDQALEAARLREAQAKLDQEQRAKQAAEPQAKPVKPSPSRNASTASIDLLEVVATLLPGFSASRTVTVKQPPVFKALWTAHRSKAQTSGDLALLTSATVLMAAVERLGAHRVVGIGGQWHDRSVAVWMDATDGTVLATTESADTYLSGL